MCCPALEGVDVGDGEDCGGDEPGQSKDRADDQGDGHDEQIQVVP